MISPVPFLTFRGFLNRFRPAVLVALLVAAIVSTATAAEAPEMKRHYDNSTRLQKLHPSMINKAGAVLADLESHGDKPVIQPGVWRTPAEQARLVKMGRSTVSYSFHTVTDPGNKPAALAFDVADYYKGYSVGNDFWLRLASSAESHDLTTGVYWGLSQTHRDRIHQYIKARDFTHAYTRGWDPSHVETRAVTLGQAKAGKRPPLPRN